MAKQKTKHLTKSKLSIKFVDRGNVAIIEGDLDCKKIDHTHPDGFEITHLDGTKEIIDAWVLLVKGECKARGMNNL